MERLDTPPEVNGKAFRTALEVLQAETTWERRLAASQVLATYYVADQLKRIADAIEDQEEF